eukprot:TRINITY_DN235_c0_g2_i1.p1 TRINITY_DN235_c0_g2~~TRINITY_DN235_c0_g2_i1.p1  ORF type:complete len:696 (-),score=159.26 TRINITY_DN235_c0_g2_i1:39-2126(-)
MSSFLAVVPTRALVVKADVKPDTCYYHVFSGPGEEAVKLRTTRFSELCKLHLALVNEMGVSFQARLPRKTLRRITDPSVIETRRGDIELYLRVASVSAGQTAAFKKFFESAEPPPLGRGISQESFLSESGQAPSVSSEQGPAMGRTMGPSASEAAFFGETIVEGEDEDDDELVGRSFNQELLSLLDEKKEAVQQVTDTVRNLEDQLASGDEAMETKRLEATATAGSAKQAASVLYTHQYVLKDLEEDIGKNKGVHATQQSVRGKAADRLEEEVTAAKAVTKKSQARYEAAHQAVIDHDTASRDELVKLELGVFDVEAALACVVEQKTSINSVLSVLQSRVKSASAATAAAERERDARAEAAALLATESTGADAACKASEEKHNACALECAEHEKQKAARKRTIELLVRRANERVVLAERIRDLRSRGAIGGEDRAVIEEAESRAKDEADAAATALKHAQEKRDETSEADAAETNRLNALCSTAASNLKHRERIAATLRTRLAEGQAALRQAEGSLKTAKAVENAAVNELEVLQKRMGEDIAVAEAECSKNLAAAKAAVADARMKAEGEQTRLKHLEEAENAALRRNEIDEASFVQSFDEARLSAAEAENYFSDYIKLSAQLVKDELDAVEALIAHHEKVENTALEDAGNKDAAWAEEKEAIKAKLHRASLQAARAQNDLEAAQSLRKSILAKDKK